MQSISRVALIFGELSYNIPDNIHVIIKTTDDIIKISSAHGAGSDYHGEEGFLEINADTDVGWMENKSLVVFCEKSDLASVNDALIKVDVAFQKCKNYKPNNCINLLIGKYFDAVYEEDGKLINKTYRMKKGRLEVAKIIPKNRAENSTEFRLSELILKPAANIGITDPPSVEEAANTNEDSVGPTDTDAEEGEIIEQDVPTGDVPIDNVVLPAAAEVGNIEVQNAADQSNVPVNLGPNNAAAGGVSFTEPVSTEIAADASVNQSTSVLSDDDIMAILSDLASTDNACVYDGLNTVKIRKNFISRCLDEKNYATNLIMCFIAYSAASKDFGKLKSKRVDTSKTAQLIKDISQMNVIVTGTLNSDTLTLPRLAIAFMPEYFLWRKSMAQNLVSHVSSIDKIYQDVVFSGCVDIKSIPGFDDFNLYYSSRIKLVSNENGKRVHGVDQNDAKFKAEVEGWNVIAMQGFDKEDDEFKKKMKAYVSAAHIDKKDAYMMIYESYSVYK